MKKPAILIAGQFYSVTAYLIENGVTFFTPEDSDDPERVDMIVGQAWIRDSMGVSWNTSHIENALASNRLAVLGV